MFIIVVAAVLLALAVYTLISGRRKKKALLAAVKACETGEDATGLYGASHLQHEGPGAMVSPLVASRGIYQPRR